MMRGLTTQLADSGPDLADELLPVCQDATPAMTAGAPIQSPVHALHQEILKSGLVMAETDSRHETAHGGLVLALIPTASAALWFVFIELVSRLT
jgi:hypothetical protein